MESSKKSKKHAKIRRKDVKRTFQRTGDKKQTRIRILRLLSSIMVEERCMGEEAGRANHRGSHTSENAGMSSEKVSENLTRRKPKDS